MLRVRELERIPIVLWSQFWSSSEEGWGSFKDSLRGSWAQPFRSFMLSNGPLSTRMKSNFLHIAMIQGSVQRGFQTVVRDCRLTRVYQEQTKIQRQTSFLSHSWGTENLHTICNSKNIVCVLSCTWLRVPPVALHVSRYTCRNWFLDFIAFCRCSTGVALHPLVVGVAPPPPPLCRQVSHRNLGLKRCCATQGCRSYSCGCRATLCN